MRVALAFRKIQRILFGATYFFYPDTSVPMIPDFAVPWRLKVFGLDVWLSF